MKVFKKLLAATAAMVMVSSVCWGGYQPLIGNQNTVSAEKYSDEIKYEDHLSYRKVDEDENGTYDYIEIIDCDESAVSVEIPSEIDEVPVTEIEKGAFSDCSGLTSIVIPDSVTTIGDNAFSGCSGLTNIKIPNSVTYIGSNAFENCIGLESVEIPDSLTEIGFWLFRNCTGLTSIVIPDSVTTIGDNAFSGCSGLTSAEIPDSVTYIGSFAFFGCTSLKSVEIPDSVTTIRERVFSGTPFLENQIGVKYAGKWVIGCDNDVVKAEIKSGTKAIAVGAFLRCSGLESVVIPDSVTEIVRTAFFGCTGLKSVVIPNSVTHIRNSAFEDCIGLESIVIPDNVTAIELWAFKECAGLTSITIKNPECEIISDPGTICNGYDENNNAYFNGTIYGYENSTAQAYAEKNDYKFESLGEPPVTTAPPTTTVPPATTVPPTITTPPASESETQKTKIVIDDQRDINYFDPQGLEAGHVYRKQDLGYTPTELIIPKTYNGKPVWLLGRTHVTHFSTDINIPATQIYYGPFFNCYKLKRVFIPDTITNALGIFETDQDLPEDSVNKKDLDIYVYSDDIQNFFERSYGETIFRKGYSYYDVSYSALIDGEVLEELTVPENITEITESAFLKCKSLKKVTVPNTVTSIGQWAFYSPNLESITICNPNCVIAEDAIANHLNGDFKFDGVIYGYKNSTAQAYAEEYGYTFEEISDEPPITTGVTTAAVTTTTTASTTIIPVSTEPVTTTTGQGTTNPATPILIGDISGSGKIDLSDAIIIAQFILGKRTFTDEEKVIADINKDGEINLLDAIEIAGYILQDMKK